MEEIKIWIPKWIWVLLNKTEDLIGVPVNTTITHALEEYYGYGQTTEKEKENNESGKTTNNAERDRASIEKVYV